MSKCNTAAKNTAITNRIQHDTLQTERHLSINKKHQLLQSFCSPFSSIATSFVEEIHGLANRLEVHKNIKWLRPEINSTQIHKCTCFAGTYSDLKCTICNTESSPVMHLLVPLLAMLRIRCVIIHAL